MSNFQFGLWSGTAINDTSSVVAAFSYSKAAGEMATIVKLTRALMIVPVCLGLIGLNGIGVNNKGRNKGMLKKLFLGSSSGLLWLLSFHLSAWYLKWFFLT